MEGRVEGESRAHRDLLERPGVFGCTIVIWGAFASKVKDVVDEPSPHARFKIDVERIHTERRRTN